MYCLIRIHAVCPCKLSVHGAFAVRCSLRARLAVTCGNPDGSSLDSWPDEWGGWGTETMQWKSCANYSGWEWRREDRGIFWGAVCLHAWTEKLAMSEQNKLSTTGKKRYKLFVQNWRSPRARQLQMQKKLVSEKEKQKRSELEREFWVTVKRLALQNHGLQESLEECSWSSRIRRNSS